MYCTVSQIKFETLTLKLSLFDYSHVNILANEIVPIVLVPPPATNLNNNNK